MTKLLCLIGLHGWAYSGLWSRECWRCERTQRKGAKGTTDRHGWTDTLERQRINHSRELRSRLDHM